MQNTFYSKYIKRLLDILISGFALIVLAIPMAILACIVKRKLGSPVIFHQDRPGRIDPKTGQEKIFRLCKFRSMTDEKDENGNLLPDEIRLTAFGKKLRSTSLDELPELWNIFKGDMSIIGPRPLLVEYLPYYTEEEKKRHLVRPGLSGLAQVSGRNFVEWNKRLALDVEYVNTISLKTDIQIFFKTINVVLNRNNVSVVSDDAEGNLAEIRSAENH